MDQLHDWASDSDSEDLLEIEWKYQQGQEILLMVDMSLIGGDAGYNIQDLFRKSHWVTYEGGLRMVDQHGNPTQVLNEVETVFFDVHTWGSDPKSADQYPMPLGFKIKHPYVNGFRNSGVTVNSWKSNYYGYLSAH
ncbi:hypothetical protein [Chitinimonas taiwanensis]|uniref:hypothetical protein n=1 Tax=Chitinimonas taiwanensis TaxID=240412 RepID=UPI0035AE1870